MIKNSRTSLQVTWSKITNTSQNDYMTIIVIMIGWSAYWQWKSVISQFGNSMKEKKFHSYSANSPRLTNSILECQTTWNLRFLKSKIQHLQFRKNKNTLLKSLNRNDIFQEEAFLFRAEKFIIVQDSQGFSLAISTLKFWEADGKFSKSCYHYVCLLPPNSLLQFSY